MVKVIDMDAKTGDADSPTTTPQSRDVIGLSAEEAAAAKAKLSPSTSLDFSTDRRPSQMALIAHADKSGKLASKLADAKDNDDAISYSTEIADNDANRSAKRMARAGRYSRHILIAAVLATVLICAAMSTRLIFLAYSESQEVKPAESEGRSIAAQPILGNPQDENTLVAIFPDDSWFMGSSEKETDPPVATTTLSTEAPAPPPLVADDLLKESESHSNGLASQESERKEEEHIQPPEDMSFKAWWSFTKRLMNQELKKTGEHLKRVGHDIQHETRKLGDTLRRTSAVVADHVGEGLKVAEVHAVKIGENIARSSEVVVHTVRDAIARRNSQKK